MNDVVDTQEQLVQRAIQASVAGDNATSIRLLQQAIARPDRIGVAHFLLGSAYAQVEQYADAIGEMETAVLLDPNLHIARLQAGLLHMTCANPARATQLFSPLLSLGENDALACFAQGLLLLIEDRFAESIVQLQRGMSLNTTNAALNGDMQKLIDRMGPLLQGMPSAATSDGASTNENVPSHLFLSAYTSNQRH